MPDTPEKLTDHYRKLAAEEVAMANVALTNEARARHYAKAANYKLANAAQLQATQLRMKSVATATTRRSQAVAAGRKATRLMPKLIQNALPES